MKKTAIAVALVGAMSAVSFSAQAAMAPMPVSALDVTAGSFQLGTGAVNPWAGTLPMETAGTLIPGAFSFGTPVDIVANGDGLHATITGSTLNLDLSNFAIFWNGGNISQPPLPGTLNVTFDDTDMSFSADWETTTPLFQPGFWKMEGTVSAVPVPAAVWLFGSGLLGLAGFMRKKKAA